MDVYVRLTNATQAAVEPLGGAVLSPGDPVVIGTTAPHHAASTGAALAPMGGAMRGIH